MKELLTKEVREIACDLAYEGKSGFLRINDKVVMKKSHNAVLFFYAPIEDGTDKSDYLIDIIRFGMLLDFSLLSK